jgi:hypothetical protein
MDHQKVLNQNFCGRSGTTKCVAFNDNALIRLQYANASIPGELDNDHAMQQDKDGHPLL